MSLGERPRYLLRFSSFLFPKYYLWSFKYPLYTGDTKYFTQLGVQAFVNYPPSIFGHSSKWTMQPGCEVEKRLNHVIWQELAQNHLPPLHSDLPLIKFGLLKYLRPQTGPCKPGEELPRRLLLHVPSLKNCGVRRWYRHGIMVVCFNWVFDFLVNSSRAGMVKHPHYIFELNTDSMVN